jgi:hypothetical protein
MTTEARQLATATSDITVWRVGYRHEPWAWPSWQYATNGRYPGRWDDADGNFRTNAPRESRALPAEQRTSGPQRVAAWGQVRGLMPADCT